MPADDSTQARRPQWPDIVIAIASAFALSAATWLPREMIAGGGAGLGTAAEQWLWAAYTIGGVLGFIGLFVAVKRRAIARGIVVAAGLVVLGGFFALQRPTALAISSLVATGLALLASAPFLGATPPREEEIKRR